MIQPFPHSEDAEKWLIRSLLLAPGTVAPLCSNRLTSKAFGSPSNGILFDLVHEWPAPEKEVDLIWLTDRLRSCRQLDEVGGEDALRELYVVLPCPENANFYINIVLDNYRRRRTIQFANTVSCRCYDKEEDLGKTFEEWEQEFSAIVHINNGVSELKGASLLDYSRRQIDDTDTVLGNRYVCRGGGMLFVAPSGIGKSVLTVQAATEFAIGRVSFGIKPARPLRSLIVQAEDDPGDVIEMARVVKHLNLSQEQQEQVGKNTWVEFVNDLTGRAFIAAVDRFLQSRPVDLVWINPYSSYLGDDIKDDKANALFLRNWLNPVLTKHRCAAVIVHHTPKTNHRGDTSEWKPSDWQYGGAGAAVLTNWARAVLVVDPTNMPGVYRFIAAKRGQRLGWQTGEQYYAHSRDGKLIWVPANCDEISCVAKPGPKKPDDLLPLIPVVDPISQEKLFLTATAPPHKIGQNKVRDFLKILLEDNQIAERQIPRAGKKSAVGYVRTNQS